MPFLDELRRKITAQLPDWLTGQQSYPEGAAQVRATHQPMQVVPDEQWGEVANALGGRNSFGFTTKGIGQSPKVYVPERETAAGTIQSPSGYDANARTPSGAIPQSPVLRHEIIHQILSGTDQKLPITDVLNLIGESGRGALFGKNYNFQQSAQEVPARLMTDPASMNMSSDAGQDAAMKYYEMIKKLDPIKAKKFADFAKLPIPQGQARQNYDGQSVQPPNYGF
jgi:hypothetical protein